MAVWVCRFWVRCVWEYDSSSYFSPFKFTAWRNIQWRSEKALFGFGAEATKDEPYQFCPAKKMLGAGCRRKSMMILWVTPADTFSHSHHKPTQHDSSSDSGNWWEKCGKTRDTTERGEPRRWSADREEASQVNLWPQHWFVLDWPFTFVENPSFLRIVSHNNSLQTGVKWSIVKLFRRPIFFSHFEKKMTGMAYCTKWRRYSCVPQKRSRHL